MSTLISLFHYVRGTKLIMPRLCNWDVPTCKTLTKEALKAMPSLATAISRLKDIYELIVGSQQVPFQGFVHEPKNFKETVSKSNWLLHSPMPEDTFKVGTVAAPSIVQEDKSESSNSAGQSTDIVIFEDKEEPASGVGEVMEEVEKGEIN